LLRSNISRKTLPVSASVRSESPYRNRNASPRLAEQTQRAAAKLAQMQLASATEAERKRLEHEVREEHIAGAEAEAEERNRKLGEIYSEIDSLLAVSLAVDDYVDLKTLRILVEHPPFSPPELEKRIPAPD
jgi:restriction system protein